MQVGIGGTTCSLCEQGIPRRRALRAWVGVLEDVGRPEADPARSLAMQGLGNGLSQANHEDALSRGSRLSCLEAAPHGPGEAYSSCRAIFQRVLLTGTRLDEALVIDREMYYGTLRLNGEDHETHTYQPPILLRSLNSLQRFEEANPLCAK